MVRKSSTNFVIFSIILDFCGIVLALFIPNNIRPLFNGLLWIKKVNPNQHLPFWIYIIFPIIWVLTLQHFAIYNQLHRGNVIQNIKSILFTSPLAGIILSGFLYLSYRELSRFQFLLFLALGIFLLVFWRFIYYYLTKYLIKNNLEVKKILIIGNPSIETYLKEKFQDKGGNLLTILHLPGNIELLKISNDDISKIINFIEQQSVHEVVISTNFTIRDNLNSLVTALHTQPISIWLLPEYLDLALHRAEIVSIGGIHLVNLRAPALSEDQRLIKRMFDLVFGTIFLLLAIPIMAIIAMIIKLESPGPVIFRQKRIGENGKIFEMYKFRTMFEGADELRHTVEQYDSAGNLMYKFPNDPRITRFGKILRRTSLDEIPQLINVLKGEMSLVGPRPELPYLVEKYQLWQRKRFTVPQGMTGWWQVNGRSDRPMHLHTEDDIYYVQNYSLLLDIKILIKTFWVILKRKGAY